jgi:hypothetical protein
MSFRFSRTIELLLHATKGLRWGTLLRAWPEPRLPTSLCTKRWHQVVSRSPSFLKSGLLIDCFLKIALDRSSAATWRASLMAAYSRRRAGAIFKAHVTEAAPWLRASPAATALSGDGLPRGVVRGFVAQ